MAQRSGTTGAELVGRESELEALREFLGSASAPRMLVLNGPPGMGKTTMWEAGCALAVESGFRVLRARASDTEVELAHGSVADLLEKVTPAELQTLPPPQHQALRVALLRSEPVDGSADARAVGTGLTAILRHLSEKERPLLVAVDDVQWLDQASAAALSFAARRTTRDQISFLLTRRSEADPSGLETTGEPPEEVEVGPLTLGAIRHLLVQRLDLRLPRPVLRRIFETSSGNPLFALEIGRALGRRDQPDRWDDLPLPDRVEDLLGRRVDDLDASVRAALLAVSLTHEVRVDQLTAVVGVGALEEAVDAGVIVLDGDRAGAAHPLLTAAARKRATTVERRKVHRALAAVTVDGESRALHLALAEHRPSESLAAEISTAVRRAAARGAVGEALVLAEHAMRLTPSDSPAWEDRLVDLSEQASAAGDEARTMTLLEQRVDSLSRPQLRARARLLLIESHGVDSTHEQARAHLERAIGESSSDPGLHARVLAYGSMFAAAVWVEGLPEAETLAERAVAAAGVLGPEALRDPLWALAWSRILRGRPIDVLTQLQSVDVTGADLLVSLDRAQAVRRIWRGEGAAVALGTLIEQADELHQVTAGLVLRLHRCELALRQGNWAPAEEQLDDLDQAGEAPALSPAMERCRALLEIGRGDLERSGKWAAMAIEEGEAHNTWDLLEALRAKGIAALLAHDPAGAAECLRRVWAHTRDEGVDDPGAFPVAPELVEALVELGELDEARGVIERLSTLAEQQDHPWGLATAKRCGGLVAFASGGDGSLQLEGAAADYLALGLRCDHARCFLALGRALRRTRRWGAARAALDTAVTAFDTLGSPGWVADARSELERVGGRRAAADGALTGAERRVAELAAAGCSNKEIAASLFVTVNTVETHLSRAYAKLGVRSRSQLAARLQAES